MDQLLAAHAVDDLTQYYPLYKFNLITREFFVKSDGDWMQIENLYQVGGTPDEIPSKLKEKVVVVGNSGEVEDIQVEREIVEVMNSCEVGVTPVGSPPKVEKEIFEVMNSCEVGVTPVGSPPKAEGKIGEKTNEKRTVTVREHHSTKSGGRKPPPKFPLKSQKNHPINYSGDLGC